VSVSIRRIESDGALRLLGETTKENSHAQLDERRAFPNAGNSTRKHFLAKRVGRLPPALLGDSPTWFTHLIRMATPSTSGNESRDGPTAF
jgi:hypothetical protein